MGDPGDGVWYSVGSFAGSNFRVVVIDLDRQFSKLGRRRDYNLGEGGRFESFQGQQSKNIRW